MRDEGIIEKLLVEVGVEIGISEGLTQGEKFGLLMLFEMVEKILLKKIVLSKKDLTAQKGKGEG